MQNHEVKNDSSSDSQMASDMNQQTSIVNKEAKKKKSVSMNIDENQVKIVNSQNDDDEVQQIKLGASSSSSLLSRDGNQLSNQNNSANITGRKRSKNALQNYDESVVKSPARKRQRNSNVNKNSNTCDTDNEYVNTGHLTYAQLQRFQHQEQVAFQNQMIEEGVH